MKTNHAMTAALAIKKYGSTHGLNDSQVQQDYAGFVSDAITLAREKGSGQVFAEAETGTGKTIGYLVAAGLDCARHGARAIISTYTLALQRQILHNDIHKAIAIVRDATGVTLRAAYRIGRRNFVDPDRASRVIQTKLSDTKISDDDRDALESLDTWAAEHPGAEIRDFLDGNPDIECMPAGLVLEDICISASTNKGGPAYAKYLEHVNAAHEADIVITNHAMLVADAMYGDSEILHDSDDPRGIGSIIIDECDRMPDAARSATSNVFSLHELKVALDKWAKHCGKKDPTEPARKALTTMFGTMDRVALETGSAANQAGQEDVRFWGELSKDHAKSVDIALRALSNTLEQFAHMHKLPGFIQASGRSEAHDDLRALTRLSKDAVRIHDAITGQGLDSHLLALRWSPTRKWPSIKTFQINPAHVLRRVWSEWTAEREAAHEKKSPQSASADASDKVLLRRVLTEKRRASALVLTSATVSAPSKSGKVNFVEMEIAFGIYNKTNPCADLMTQRSPTFAPTKFGTVRFVFSHPAAPPVYDKNDFAAGMWADENGGARPHNPDWVRYCAQAAQQAHKVGGRTLVLTNSYAAAEKIAAELRGLSLPVIEKTRLNTADACLRRFVDGRDAIYVSPGAWEGFDPSQIVDADGNKVRVKHVVITQAPFPNADGALQKALRDYLKSRGIAASRVEQIVYGNARAAALRRFRQGFGRGIRSLTDSFTAWLCDPRFPRSPAMRNLLGEAGTMVRTDFLYAIPRRFRESTTSISPWERGDTLDLDGSLLEYGDLIEAV